jgi:hypothetical protein
LNNENKRKKEKRMELIREVAKVYGSMAELMRLWNDGNPLSVFVETSARESERCECNHVYAAYYDSAVDDGYIEQKLERRELDDTKTLHAYHTWMMTEQSVTEKIEKNEKEAELIGGMLLPKKINTNNTAPVETEGDVSGERSYTLICSDWREISIEGDLVEPYTMFRCHFQ